MRSPWQVQGNRIIPTEHQVRLAKRPNGAQEQSASILDLLSFIGSGISSLPRIFIMRSPWQVDCFVFSGSWRCFHFYYAARMTSGSVHVEPAFKPALGLAFELAF
jgi:hypothetical protein